MPYKQLTQFFGSKPNTPLLAHSVQAEAADGWPEYLTRSGRGAAETHLHSLSYEEDE